MIPQSASSISDFKTCTMLYFFRHVLRLRPIEDPEVFRVGTNWHKCLEILRLTPGKSCSCCCAVDGTVRSGKDYMDCPVCENQRIIPEDHRMALIRYMTKAYETCPPSINLTDWEIERTVLLYSAIGWQWHWQDDEIETLATEVSFNNQVNGVYSRRGRIDEIIRHSGRLAVGEHKSTSKPIDSDAFYWDGLRLDSQPTMYLIEARRAQLAGELEQYGVSASDPLISGVLYDVWHKPTIRPKKLSQADTKKFIADGKYLDEKFETEYFGEKFEAEIVSCSEPHGVDIRVNGVLTIITAGKVPKPTKKNPEPLAPLAIRETPEMFGARLLADIQENPGKHFARKEIPRTDQELAIAEDEFFRIARLADFMTKRDLWFVNEHSCNATYRCSFAAICTHRVDVSNGQVPEGFKCLNTK